VAAEIKKATGLDTELKVGGGGEFTVWLDEQLVAEKKMGMFPSPNDVVTALKSALSPGA
jgi:hypothetical protein